jgi:mannose-6-phosphate isomerase
MNRLAAAIDMLKDWYVGAALPLWARVAADARGAFHESLDFGGRPIVGQPRRVRVQCRQIHTFANAARRGWLVEGERIAAKGFGRLVETACPEGGARGCVHLIDDDGGVIDTTRDLYDQAFLLLACAARIGTADDSAARDLSARTQDFLDRELASNAGGYFEDDRRKTPRRQNPHMHLFEATMALHAATGDVLWLDRARELERLFNTRFLDRGRGVLREFFADDWTPAIGDRLEPGHMAEWCFLLDRFAALAGEDRARTRDVLYKGAVSFRDGPFLPNRAALGAQGSGARRLWPQTELLRASLIAARDGDQAAGSRAADLIDALFASYLDQPAPGLWCDEYDADGAAVAKDVPASILYHLHEAVCCAADCRDKLS